MRFRINGREYDESSALKIVEAMRRDENEECSSTREFLLWAHMQLHDRIPARELDVSDRLNDETLALNFLCLCDEYGVGELFEAPPERDKPQKTANRKSKTARRR